MATTARQLLPYGDVIFYCAGIASTTSAMIAATFSAIRVTFALGRSTDLSPWFAELHPTYRSPHRAALLCGALVMLMLLSLPIMEVASAASQMFALLFGLVCFATLRLRKHQAALVRPFRAPALPWLAGVGIAAGGIVIVTLFNMRPLAWGLSCVWLIAGSVMYRMRHKMSRVRAGEGEA